MSVTSTAQTQAGPIPDQAPVPIEDLPLSPGETLDVDSAPTAIEAPPPPELSTTLTDKQVSRAYQRTAYQAVRACGLESGLRIGEQLQIEFTLSRETGRVKSVTFPNGGDTELTRCVKTAMQKQMAVDPFFRGGKSSYTVTHEF